MKAAATKHILKPAPQQRARSSGDRAPLLVTKQHSATMVGAASWALDDAARWVSRHPPLDGEAEEGSSNCSSSDSELQAQTSSAEEDADGTALLLSHAERDLNTLAQESGALSIGKATALSRTISCATSTLAHKKVPDGDSIYDFGYVRHKQSAVACDF